ncbi:rhodanese domain-containing protein CG4456-like [Phymastichus coffea]|uniref:rhodanese domain-containing protein CG4456-like n=1 Tax=Phymastichus coffea TaxID=108790 RepID=UPI00273BBBC8|nr:rhodanese domain-containing protein CG4456-like [Phymastichus coffea]XP_058788627.1 rhodanese domain-containing protein CG4456-like [Phymastichus coffea]
MNGGLIDYNKMLEAQKDDKILILDVRENSEIQETGKLPGSIHIPMKEVMNELNLSNEEFEKTYGKKKPSLDTQIITSCRLGGRSAKVQAELQNAGYKNVLNYSGGWADWEKHQKK